MPHCNQERIERQRVWSPDKRGSAVSSVGRGEQAEAPYVQSLDRLVVSRTVDEKVELSRWSSRPSTL